MIKETLERYHYCVVSCDGNYGRVLSRHLCQESADAALERRAAAVLRRYPDAITHLMYAVARVSAQKGARVRLP